MQNYTILQFRNLYFFSDDFNGYRSRPTAWNELRWKQHLDTLHESDYQMAAKKKFANLKNSLKEFVPF